MAEKRLTALSQEAHIPSISTRPVNDLVRAMGGIGLRRSQVSGLCDEIDERVNVCLGRPIGGVWLYLCITRPPWRGSPTAAVDWRFSAWMSAPLKPRPSGPPSCASWHAAACGGGKSVISDAHESIEPRKPIS